MVREKSGPTTLTVLFRNCAPKSQTSVSGNAATSYAYLAEFHGEASRAKVISWAAMFMSIGLILLPSLAWLIIPLDAQLDLRLFGMRYAMWRIYLLLCSLDLLLIIAGLLYLPESGKFLLTGGHREKVVQTLAKIYQLNRGKPAHVSKGYSVRFCRAGATGAGGKPSRGTRRPRTRRRR